MRKHFITFHYKGSLLTKYYLNDYGKLLMMGNDLLLTGMKNNNKLNNMITIMQGFINIFHNRRINKMRVSSNDHAKFVGCFLALMKLNIIKEDDNNGYIILKN